MLLGGLAGAWGIHRVTVDVIRVRDVDGVPSADRMKHLGEPSYPFAPGSERETLVGYDNWVINESSRPVRIERFSYGRFSIGLGKSPPTIVPPGTVVMTSSIDFIGPYSSPPSSLAVEGFEAKVGMTSRSWLTWDVGDRGR